MEALLPVFKNLLPVPMTRRILIIDDEDDIRQVAGMSLETVAGWDVVLANSGKQGIERASSEQPDAILLDVMMPEMDGPTTYSNSRPAVKLLIFPSCS